MMRKNSHFQNGWMGKWMNYMEICANFKNGACQSWRGKEGLGWYGMVWSAVYFARLLQSAPCQKVSDFGTWGMFVIIIISPGEAAHFSQCFHDWAGQYGGRGVEGGASGCCVVLGRAGQGRTGQTFMKYGCQFFLRCSVLRPWVRGTFISFNFLEIFFHPSTLRFSFEFFFSVYSWGEVVGYWRFSVWCLCFFPLNAS